MCTFDVETAAYLVGGCAVVAVVGAAWNGERYLSAWFEAFSRLLGVFAIVGTVGCLLQAFPNVMLALFWTIVAVIIGGGWWFSRQEERERKKKK